MSDNTKITVAFLDYKKVFDNKNTITTLVPGNTTIEITAEKNGYNPKTIFYSDVASTSTISTAIQNIIIDEPYQAVTLTVNSSTPDTTLEFYCDTGTVNGNTITVAKGTKVRYTLSKTGYNTLDRNIYINENTIENESLDEAIFKYTVNTSSTKTITIPFTTVSTMLTEWNNANATLTIDWGDGTTSTVGRSFSESQITHTYTGNSYQISITSNKNVMPLFYTYRSTAQALLITSIDTPFLKMCGKEATYLLSYCGNLTTVPTNLLKYNSHLTSLNYGFYYLNYNSNLTFTIPENLLYYCTELETVNRIFQQYSNSNTSKILTIPEKIFYYSNKITSAQYAFYNCRGVTSISENLLSKLPCLNNIYGIFGYMTSITAIPENLFKYNPNLVYVNNAFYYCYNNRTIPENLFKYNPKLEDCSSTFYYNRYVTSISGNIFKYNLKLKNVSGVFNNCQQITAVPTDIFENNTLLSNVLNAFNSCEVSNISPLEYLAILPNSVTSCGGFSGWTKTTSEYATSEYIAAFYNKIHSFAYLFSGWNITQPPEHCFDTYPDVTNFGYAFYNCSNITSIPEDLFKYNTNVTSFEYTFYNCYSLTSLPANLFKYNTEATSFYYTFGYCSGLTTIPTDLFRYNTKVTTFAYTFNHCSALTTLPADLFRYNLKVTSFYMTFYYCNKLTMRSDIFGSDMTNRFKQQSSLTFYYFFYVYNWSGTRGTAPALWNCTFTDSYGYTITPTKTYCFGGNSSSSLSNYSSIPSEWRS